MAVNNANTIKVLWVTSLVQEPKHFAKAFCTQSVTFCVNPIQINLFLTNFTATSH